MNMHERQIQLRTKITQDGGDRWWWLN